MSVATTNTIKPIREMSDAEFHAAYSCNRITAEIIRNAMIMAVRHMTDALQRSSFSPIVRDQRDMACGVFAGPEEDYDVVALAEGCMLHITTAPYSVRELIKEYGAENLKPGDVIVSNDPFRGGNHILDVTLVRPVFIDGKLEFFAANRAHHPDMGGSNPGGWNGGSVRKTYEEGIRVGPALLYADDQPVRTTFNLFLDNTRLPHNSLGDLRAQYGGCVVGERLLTQLVEKYGLEVVKGAIRYILDHGEQSMQSAIEEMPDGTYEFTDYLDDDGIDVDHPIRFHAAVTIRGGRAEVDLSGTERQCEGNIAGVWSISASGVVIAFKMIVDPFTPLNAGAMRPLDMIFPPGSMVNCLPPTSNVAGNVIQTERVASVVYGALANAVPERGFAENLSSSAIMCWGGEDHRGDVPEPFVYMQISMGGWGGTATSDGLPYCLSVVGNCSEIPAEIMEIEYPIISVDKEFMIDTAGPGMFRGGPGVTFTSRCETDAEMSLCCDRMRTSAWGVFGGGAALPQALYEVIDGEAPFEKGWSPVDSMKLISGRFDESGLADSDGDGWRTDKFSHKRVEGGITMRMVNSGGGGYGDPLDREAWRVAEDVRNELVSAGAAHDQYGVVLGEGFTVDEAATEQLRAKIRGESEDERARRLKHSGWRDRTWFEGGSK